MGIEKQIPMHRRPHRFDPRPHGESLASEPIKRYVVATVRILNHVYDFRYLRLEAARCLSVFADYRCRTRRDADGVNDFGVAASVPRRDDVRRGDYPGTVCVR